MTPVEIQKILENQSRYFESGATLPVKSRIAALKKLHAAIKQNEKMITQALTQDLGKSDLEGFMCEAGLVLGEISYMIKNIRKFARNEKKATCITNFAASTFVKKSPRGKVLIMSPWNYPFLLSMDPLVDAIAAGNTVVLKPSAYSANTSREIARLLEVVFSPEYVAVVTGGRAENRLRAHDLRLRDERFRRIPRGGGQHLLSGNRRHPLLRRRHGNARRAAQ